MACIAFLQHTILASWHVRHGLTALNHVDRSLNSPRLASTELAPAPIPKLDLSPPPQGMKAHAKAGSVAAQMHCSAKWG